jgi:SAM-dependent methyltransferase
VSSETDRNIAAFNRTDVVSDYRNMAALTGAEEQLFARYLRPGMDVLDLGVGTGRTTPALRALGGRYVGVDVAEEMVRAAREAHPGTDFRTGDASDLSDFADGSFDAVVFSYNGIDYIHPEPARQRSLIECRRVLGPSGVFIFSSHNARMLFPAVDTRGLSPGHRIKRRLGAIARSPRFVLRRGRQATYWRGHGYLLDPVRGGLTTYEATPEHVTADAVATGFALADVVASVAPAKRGRSRVPWYYYACVTSGGSTSQ